MMNCLEAVKKTSKTAASCAYWTLWGQEAPTPSKMGNLHFFYRVMLLLKGKYFQRSVTCSHFLTHASHSLTSCTQFYFDLKKCIPLIMFNIHFCVDIFDFKPSTKIVLLLMLLKPSEPRIHSYYKKLLTLQFFRIVVTLPQKPSISKRQLCKNDSLGIVWVPSES